MAEFKYAPMFQLGEDTTEYYRIPGSEQYVSTAEFEGKKILKIQKEALTIMANTAFRDVSFLLRRSHNEQVAKILSDPEASENDKYVALTFLRNAEVSAKGKLPLCQDTGTAIIHGEKGQQVWTGFDDKEALSLGVYKTYTEENLRYSQNAPLDMYKEVNTKCNLPAQIDIDAEEGDEYRFLCVTKGGGSANKTYLYQETKARIQNPGTLVPFLVEKMRSLGTAACPPYHIAFVIGGTSAEKNLLTVKLASTHYYDSLPTTGDETGRAFRDVALEAQLLEEAHKIGLGAQFGGKYMAHDVRVVRLPRHGASCPIGLGVSCSADRNIKAKINADGIWIEKMDDKPYELIPEELRQAGEGDAVKVDLNRPMSEVCAQLSNYPVSTRLSLNGTIIVGRDIAHAKLKARLDSYNVPGVAWRTIHFKPISGRLAGKLIHGVQYHYTDFEAAQITMTQFYVMQAVHELAPSHNPFVGGSYAMFDKCSGSDYIRKTFSKTFSVTFSVTCGKSFGVSYLSSIFFFFFYNVNKIHIWYCRSGYFNNVKWGGNVEKIFLHKHFTRNICFIRLC